MYLIYNNITVLKNINIILIVILRTTLNLILLGILEISYKLLYIM